MFQDVLKQLRQREHLTQEELADNLGIGRSTLGMYETGRREPSFEFLQQLSEFFHVDMNTLLDVPSTSRAYSVTYNDLSQLRSCVSAPLSEKDRLIDSIQQQLHKLSDDKVKQVLSYAKFLQSKD